MRRVLAAAALAGLLAGPAVAAGYSVTSEKVKALTGPNAPGTPCGRFAGARVGRVAADKVLDTKAWEYFDGSSWVPDQAQAVEVIKPGAGEGSLVWNPGIKRWMYTTLNELSEAIELRFAERPEGPWSAPAMLARGSDYAQAYGAYMTPSWISEDGLSFWFVMSQFGPYNTYVMKATLTRAEIDPAR